MNTQFLILVVILCVALLMMTDKKKSNNAKYNQNNKNNKNNKKNNNNNNNNQNLLNNNNNVLNNVLNNQLEEKSNNTVNNTANNTVNNTVNNKLNKNSNIELQIASNHLNNKNNLLIKNVEAFQNSINNKSLTLYYSKYCGHSLNFLKVWHKLLDGNILSQEVQLNSIECNSNPEQCKNNKITSVPTLIIQNQSKKHIMNGNQSLDSILEQCKIMGFYIKDPIEEGFTSSAYYISGDVAAKFIEKSTDEDCPFVSFTQYEDYNRNKNFCASGEHGNGCVKGISGSKIGNFNAAYGQVGSYLISLPDNSQEKMNKCAAQKAESIRNFNLCGQNERLSKISTYGKDVENKVSNPLFTNTSFEDNVKISNAIRHACSQT